MGFPVFFLSYAKRWRVAFEGGCSPWMARAILPDEIPCCLRQHGTKQSQRAEGIPVGIPLFLIRKGRFLPILSAATRAKPLDAARNPPGPPRRGNAGWDSPFSSRPIHNGGVSLSRGLKPLDTACNPPRRSPVLPSAARDEAEATGRGNPRWDSPFSSRPIHNGGVSLSRGGCSPWIPRAILLAEVPCCRRRHGTKQRQRAEGIPVGIPLFFLAEVRVDLAALKVARLQVRMRLCDALRQEAHALALAAHVAADQHRLGEP